METRLFPLEKTFEIGAVEKHTVTVRYTLFARHTIWVDGKEEWNRFNWRNNYSIHVAVGEDERHDVELRVKSRPQDFSIWLDGATFLDPLFPQVTLQGIHVEASTTLARAFSVLAPAGWLLLGGMHETTPKNLLMIAIYGVALCTIIVMQYKKPRVWPPFLAMILMVSFIHGKPTSQAMLLMAVFSGITLLLGPWLRRFAMRGKSTPTEQA